MIKKFIPLTAIIAATLSTPSISNAHDLSNISNQKFNYFNANQELKEIKKINVYKSGDSDIMLKCYVVDGKITYQSIRGDSNPNDNSLIREQNKLCSEALEKYFENNICYNIKE